MGAPIKSTKRRNVGFEPILSITNFAVLCKVKSIEVHEVKFPLENEFTKKPSEYAFKGETGSKLVITFESYTEIGEIYSQQITHQPIHFGKGKDDVRNRSVTAFQSMIEQLYTALNPKRFKVMSELQDAATMFYEAMLEKCNNVAEIKAATNADWLKNPINLLFWKTLYTELATAFTTGKAVKQTDGTVKHMAMFKQSVATKKFAITDDFVAIWVTFHKNGEKGYINLPNDSFNNMTYMEAATFNADGIPNPHKLVLDAYGASLYAKTKAATKTTTVSGATVTTEDELPVEDLPIDNDLPVEELPTDELETGTTDESSTEEEPAY